jgi:hypothetical protein
MVRALDNRYLDLIEDAAYRILEHRSLLQARMHVCGCTTPRQGILKTASNQEVGIPDFIENDETAL